MDTQRWDRIQELFHNAAALSPADRDGFLNHAAESDPALVSDVQAMLQEDARGSSLLDRDVAEIADQMLGSTIPAELKELGRYRIRGILGEGGMGVVYLAERDDLGHLVAIKVLRDAWLSKVRRQRFITEQRTLAQLNHPSITRLYDADALPNGTPWFVMEYVDGVSLTDYCTLQASNIEERLKLFRAVCDAVQYAHEHGIIHRDLKPSNILVKRGGAVRLLDFGIAKHLDSPLSISDQTRTGMNLMTFAYAAPEQIRGQAASVSTDVYSLGVVLYELLAGKLPFDLTSQTPAEAATTLTTEEPAKPSTSRAGAVGASAWSDLDIVCLAAMHKDPHRRYASVQALIDDIDHYLKHEPIAARPDSWSYTAAKFYRRNRPLLSAAAAIVILAAISVALLVRSAAQSTASPRVRTLAILPFQNLGNDPEVDYLRRALADEVSGTLGYARSLSIRPADAARFAAPNLDLQRAGHDLHVDNIVTGHFLKAGEQLQITLEVTDVETNSRKWQDVFDVPSKNLVAMQAQIAAKARRGLAPVLGASEFVTGTPPKPKNEQAYQLFLHAASVPNDAESTRRAIETLEKSVALDPNYAPALEALAGRYANDAWFAAGGQRALGRWYELGSRIAQLDPDNVVFRADALYIAGQLSVRPNQSRPGLGEITRGQAYRQLADLVQRRPDRARLHFMLSWMLRDVGLLAEAARECEAAMLVDAQDAGARSCGVAFMLSGDYPRALDYLRLDPDSEVSKAVLIDVRLHQGNVQEALHLLSNAVPKWSGYDLVQAFLKHEPPPRLAALAHSVQPESDPEVNYFSAAHLAYSGQPEAALTLLKAAISGGYCGYPAIHSDPLLANLRSQPKFNEIQAQAQACQNDFLAQRQHP